MATKNKNLGATLEVASNETATTAANVKNEISTKPIIVVYESDKLNELREQKKQYKIASREFEPDSPEEEELLLKAYSVEQQIKAEIANIKAAESQLKLQEARNARVALLDAVVNSLIVNGFNPFETMTDEQLLTYQNAREVVVNELLTKFPGTKSATAKVAGEIVKTAGNSKADIVSLHVTNVAAGMTDSQSRNAIQDLGYKRSTVWFAVDGYNKSK